MELLGPVRLVRHFLAGTPNKTLIVWGAASVTLALSSAAYGLLVGPLLRVAFGGGLPALPSVVERLGSALTLEGLQAVLPWAIAGTSAVKGLAYYLERYSLSSLAIAYTHGTRTQLISSIRGRSIDELEEKGRGTLQGYVTHDLAHLEAWVSDGWAPILRDGLQVIALTITALVVSGEVGGWVLVIYPALMLPLLSLRRHLKSRARGELKELRRISQWTHAFLERLQLSKLFQSAEDHAKELRQAQGRLRAEQLSRARLLAVTPPLTELTSALAISAGLAWFLEGVNEGRWQAEQLISLFVCLVMMYAPLKSVSRAHAHWLKAQDVLSELLSLETHPSERPLQLELSGSRVTRFTWRELIICRGGVTLSSPISFSLSRGSITQLIGSNGVGKSSLIYQLLGLNPSPAGALLELDGHRFDQLGVIVHQRLVAWLPQRGTLPVSTLDALIDLIHDLKKNQREDDLAYLSHRLKITSLIQRLQERPSAELLEGLSGGERQRVLLYLTFASARPLLILDEPEAHLDQEVLTTLVELLEERRGAHACLLITHHPTLSCLADESLTLHGTSA